MKNSKLIKILALLISIVMIVGSLSACGNSGSDQDGKNHDSGSKKDENKDLLSLGDVINSLLNGSNDTFEPETMAPDDTEDPSENVESDVKGGFGNVIYVNGAYYYFKYDSGCFEDTGFFGSFSEKLVERDFVRNVNGKEENVTTLTAKGKFAYAGGSFFFSGDGEIFSVNEDDLTVSHHMNGTICGVTASGSSVIVKGTMGGLYAISSKDGTTTTLSTDQNASFVAVNGDTVYYSSTPSNPTSSQMGKISLYRIEADGSDNSCLYTSPTNPDDYGLMSNVMIARIVFDEKYVYFSYGSVAGTGSFYQGGHVVMISHDGSETKTVGDSDELYDYYFTVNKPGDVSVDTEVNSIYSDIISSHTIDDGKVYLISGAGAPVYLMDTMSYETVETKATPYFFEVVDGKVYFLVHYASRTPANDLGWRESYSRSGSVMYVKDISTGEMKKLYEF